MPSTIKEKKKKIPLKSIIGDLPPLRSGRSKGQDSASEWLKAIDDQVTDKILKEIDDEQLKDRMKSICTRKSTNLMRGGLFVETGCRSLKLKGKLADWIIDKRLGGVCQHESRSHMDSDFARYLFVSAYGELYNFTPKLKHYPDSLLPKHKGASVLIDVTQHIFHDRFRVQLAGTPATTVVSHIRKDGHYFIHYDPKQCRSLTVREVARIQTFPDNYYFEGTRTDQYQQIGNAVPPFLALQLAEVVAGVIQALDPIVAFNKPKAKKAHVETVPAS